MYHSSGVYNTTRQVQTHGFDFRSIVKAVGIVQVGMLRKAATHHFRDFLIISSNLRDGVFICLQIPETIEALANLIPSIWWD